MGFKLSEYLKKNYDEKIGTVTTGSGSLVRPFSVEVIISDLIKNGVSLYETLDILETIYPELFPNIHTNKIAKMINQALLERGYSKEYFINGILAEDTMVLLPDGNRVPLSYKFVKQLVEGLTAQFKRSSKTTRALVEEYHRMLRTLETEEIHFSTIEALKSLVMKNVINFDPWAEDHNIRIYQGIVKMYDEIVRAKGILPDEELKIMVLDFYISSFSLILFQHNYLPGISIGNTIGQLEKFISDEALLNRSGLETRDIHFIGRLGNILNKMYRNSQDPRLSYESMHSLLSELPTMMNIIHNLANLGNLSWLYVIHESGIELFSLQGKIVSKNAGMLVAAGLSGIRTILEEITEQHPKRIQTDEGQLIIERRNGYTVVVLAKIESVVLIEKIKELCYNIDAYLLRDILNFNGKVDKIQREIVRFVEKIELSKLL